MSLAKTFLAMGIAVIFAVFIGYGLYVIYEPPYERLNCSQYYDNINNYENADYKSCMEQVSQLDYSRSRNSFFILIAIGILAIVGGTFFRHLEGIGSGFIGGGILVVLWSLFYTWWLTWPRYIKVAALGVVLALLVYLGYTRIEEKLKKGKRTKK